MLLTEITGAQIRLAREKLGVSLYELAKGAGVNRLTLRFYELHGAEPLSAKTDVLGKLLRYLESEGVEFAGDGSVTLSPVLRTMRAQIAREAVAP